jgi:hypothetical protein
LRRPQSRLRDTAQTSRGKIGRLHRTPVGSTTPVLDSCGLRDWLLARPAGQASYPLLVHRAAILLHASFRPHLAATPLRFANPSPLSGWIEDFHLQAADHARHTANGSRECAPDDRLREAIRRAAKQVWIASSLSLLAMTLMEFSDSIFKEQDTSPRSRGAMRPKFCTKIVPQKRGSRERRMRAAPAVSCANCTKENAHEHTGSAEALRHSLRNGFTAYAVLSPATNSSCHRRCRLDGTSDPVGSISPPAA